VAKKPKKTRSRQPSDPGGTGSFIDRHPQTFVVAAAIMVLLPFIGKAYHIDDTLFLWTAKHIITNPLDFYGFPANWYGYDLAMSTINQNPPLAAYLIALTASVGGWGEPVMHLAFMIPAVMLVFGTYHLARSFTGRPVVAAMTALFTPVFLVSATNLMTDTLMVSFYVWAAVFWQWGLESGRARWFALSAAALSFSFLAKYYGITLVPLLAVYTLLYRRRFDPRILWLAVPVAVAAAYQLYTKSLYGTGLLTNAGNYALDRGLTEFSLLFGKTLTGFSYTGGCIIGTVLFMPLLWNKRTCVLFGALAAVLVTALVLAGQVGRYPLVGAGGFRWWTAVQVAVFATAGIHVFLLALDDVMARRDSSSAMLLCWVAGTFLFASFLNWTTNARTIYPMLPAAAILVCRRLDRSGLPTMKTGNAAMAAVFVTAMAVSFAVAHADYAYAGSQRAAARYFGAKLRPFPNKIRFQGHCGFQYYMERNGFTPLNHKHVDVTAGDIIITPLNNTNARKYTGDLIHEVERLDIVPSRFVSVMSMATGAGFYSDLWGPLPFAFGTPRPDTYLVQLVGRFDSERDAADNYRRAIDGNVSPSE